MLDYVTGEPDPLLNPLIRSYYQANLDLTKTITIKSSRSALQQNKALVEQFGSSAVDQNNPLSWKYYLNIAGEYHSTDQNMVITSLDTLQPISFTKSNLDANPNTKEQYQFGTRYYRTLVSQYPDQEDLIMGILMPCDIETAIDAEDDTILSYYKALVEDNENSLIHDLEKAIKRHSHRWYVDAFMIHESYALMSFYAILYQFMFTKLMNLREARRNTYEAHSFHVRMFLKGYMGLDQYYPQMTRQQAMYLYRNLPRLVKKIGLESQFQELIDKLLTPRNISVIGYDVRQTTELLDDYTINSIIKAVPLNEIPASTDNETITPEQLFEKESKVLKGTQEFFDANQTSVKNRLLHQSHFQLQTKDVVVLTPVGGNLYSLNLEDFALTHWAHMSASGLYDANVSFVNPRNGITQTLTALQAFIYFYYLSLTYITESLPTDLVGSVSPEDLAQLQSLQQLLIPNKVTLIPKYLAHRHVTTQTPFTTNTLLSIVRLIDRTKMTATAQDLIASRIPMIPVATPALFAELCSDMYKAYIEQHTTANLSEGILEKGYGRNMVYKMYQDTLISLAPDGSTISDFLASNNLDSYEVAQNFSQELLTNLFEAATGSALNITRTRRSVTKAMIGIMRSLTSYNIQFVEQTFEIDPTSVSIEPLTIVGGIGYTGANSDDYPSNLAQVPVGIEVLGVVATEL